MLLSLFWHGVTQNGQTRKHQYIGINSLGTHKYREQKPNPPRNLLRLDWQLSKSLNQAYIDWTVSKKPWTPYLMSLNPVL